MKLGDKVTFSKSVQKTGDSASMGYLTEQQEKELEDNGYIKLKRFALKEHKPMHGIVVGVRSIVFEVNLHESDNPYREKDYLVSESLGNTKVFLVACNLSGFKKVLPEDIELVEDIP